MLTKEQIDQAVKDCLPDVLASFKQSIIETAERSARNEMHDQVSRAVREWVQAEIVPELVEALIESKDGIISAAPVLAEGMVTAFVDSSLSEFKKRLENSWDRQKILEAFFKG